ncbi:hypothetical protein HYH03_000721 [Edaphochlamys debaryana]|uniref:Protein kinase domain-containing protein n=1 Tax=Edaphochlamys debaryana TaxID=47281 RepID=A0A835YPK4_9CHLO|nr:hypothetical protein HYH03_000721 [Edaphochlamys debaryana]|eukprot:KAG2502235.1 hypothetical protein HYH03_000721 [Edaphochlamys debaryana]
MGTFSAPLSFLDSPKGSQASTPVCTGGGHGEAPPTGTGHWPPHRLSSGNLPSSAAPNGSAPESPSHHSPRPNGTPLARHVALKAAVSRSSFKALEPTPSNRASADLPAVQRPAAQQLAVAQVPVAPLRSASSSFLPDRASGFRSTSSTTIEEERKLTPHPPGVERTSPRTMPRRLESFQSRERQPVSPGSPSQNSDSNCGSKTPALPSASSALQPSRHLAAPNGGGRSSRALAAPTSIPPYRVTITSISPLPSSNSGTNSAPVDFDLPRSPASPTRAPVYSVGPSSSPGPAALLPSALPAAAPLRSVSADVVPKDGRDSKDSKDASLAGLKNPAFFTPPPFVARSITSRDGVVYMWHGVPPQMRDNGWTMSAYTTTRQLHDGYASAVYKATCHRTGQDVVLKAYSLSTLTDFLRNQVLRELDIHSKLEHPSIVQMLGAFREGDALIMVLEYVRGGSLDRARRKLGGRMSEQQALELVMVPLLKTLHHLHGQGIVHRDIKPANLLFTPDWRLKVCDYGVSINMTEERAVTRTGSRDYMAPEVSVCPLKRTPADNKDNVHMAYGAAVDIWSLGALAYELLVGFTPYPGGPPAARKVEAALAFPSSVSAHAREFVQACLQHAPEDRPTIVDLLRHRWVQGAV